MKVLDYKEKIYAGVLGKLIGVYLGRPVEGWSYEKIQETFDEIRYYVHEEVGVPLIVADDDISGTFGFFRAIEDSGYNREMSAQDFGRAWLNYIIEDKTILWWGGLGRSTEHTAYLNLKNGIPAPQSGSAVRNGRTIAEQIGAQIFIDAIAMSCPEDPELAVSLTQKAASVSHDGLAVEAARHLAALESMAFGERNLDTLFDRAEVYVRDDRLLAMLHDVRNLCAKETDWRKVRARMDPIYGYGVWPGCCHMMPNHAMVVASILLGGDDFQRSISIAASAAWDTDCNAGNVGAFNGIRLGLEGIDTGADFRTPVADMMYVVTADGGSVVTDAVQVSDSIVRTAQHLRNEPGLSPSARYSFAYPGSTQGFHPCSFQTASNAVQSVENSNTCAEGDGLMIRCRHMAEGVQARVSTQTFIDFEKIARNFSTVASPTLYSTQTVRIRVQLLDGGNVTMRPYVLYYDINNETQILYGEESLLETKQKEILFDVPDTDGMLIARLGFAFSSKIRYDGRIVIRSIDWNGAPRHFAQRGMLMNSIWNTNPLWMAGFACSATHFQADFNQTYCVSHKETEGLVTMGTKEWENYSVRSTLYYSLHESGGLVIRSVGHRRYYGAVLRGGKEACIYMRRDEEYRELACASFPYIEDVPYEVCFRALDDLLVMDVNGQKILECRDSTFKGGAAGFVMSRGSMTCLNYIIEGEQT